MKHRSLSAGQAKTSLNRCLSAAVLLAALPSVAGCDMITEKLTEKATEAVVEAVTDAEDVDIDTDTGETTIKTKDGTITAKDHGDGEVSLTGADGSHMRTGGAAPKDFPLPVVEHQRVMQSIDSKSKGKRSRMLVLETKSKDVAALNKTYTEALEKIGELKRTEVKQDDGEMIMLSARNKETKTEAAVQIMSSSEGKGATVSLTHSVPQAK